MKKGGYTMSQEISRRNVLAAIGGTTAGMAVAGVAGGQDAADEKVKRLVLGVSCSPRSGKTTAAAVRVSLDAAAAVDTSIRTELIDLGGKSIGGWNGAGLPKDDSRSIIPRLRDPALAGLIIGSPVYFRTMSALCKAFLEQCAVLRKPKLLLANKPVGALAIGAYRNGGQELVIQEIQAAMLCHEAMIVGGRAPAFQGATLLNDGSNDITGDELGVGSAKKLGQCVAEAALRAASLTG
jgi:multimeric flavodoxin WrbA